MKFNYLYNLIHTNQSIFAGNVSITTVAQWTGQFTIKTIKEYYIHKVSEADMIASEKPNSVFEKSYQTQGLSKEEKKLILKDSRIFNNFSWVFFYFLKKSPFFKPIKNR